MKTYVRWSLGWFVLIALLGSVMRWAYVLPEFFFEYRYVVHTHSHIALLGWVYLSLNVLIAECFFDESQRHSFRKYLNAAQLTIIGMALSFPFQGYGLYSIISSSLFIIVTYFLSGYIWRKATVDKSRFSFRLLRWALIWLVISSFGPWALGAIIAKWGRESDFYKAAIYFYLHFQYNGWIFLGLLSVFIHYLEEQGKRFSQNFQRKLLWFFNAGIVFSLLLSFTKLFDRSEFYALGALGVILIALGWWFVIRVGSQAYFPHRRRWILMSVLFSVKLLMQFASAIPWVADHFFFVIFAVIGYLHWNFLGWITLSILCFMQMKGYVRLSSGVFWSYVTIFFLSELLLFYKGFSDAFSCVVYEEYFTILAVVSSLFLFPVLCFWIKSFQKNVKIR